MSATDLASELQDHLLSVVQIAQEIVSGAVETGVEQAQRLIPEYAAKLTDRLPDAAGAIDHAFRRTEEWLAARVSDPWRAHVEALGEFIRSQRQLAKLSLRDVAQRARVSNPYLSQVERGLHEPSVRVLAAIAAALDISTETLLARAGLLDDDDATAAPTTTAAAIRADDALNTEQKEALLAVYRSYIEANRT